MIDDSPGRFPVEILKEWKLLSEQAARLEIEELEKGMPERLASDLEALKIYSRAFDREAFKTAFCVEMSMTGFDKAILDTIVALSTGHLRDRDGSLLASTVGRSELNNKKWSERIGSVLELLNSLRRCFQIATADREIVIHSEGSDYEIFEIRSQELMTWMDATRMEILSLMSQILSEAGLGHLPFSHFRQSRW